MNRWNIRDNVPSVFLFGIKEYAPALAYGAAGEQAVFIGTFQGVTLGQAMRIPVIGRAEETPQKFSALLKLENIIFLLKFQQS